MARHVFLFKNVHRMFRQLISPNAIIPIRLNNNAVNEDTNNSILAFIAIYVLIFITGPGLGSVGPAGNFAHLPVTGKVLLTFIMLVGRIKIPNVLLLLLIGIITGPVSGIVTKDFFGKLGNVFTAITLIVILFESGSGLSFIEIKKAIGSATLLTLINFIITVLITSYISRWFLSMDVLSSVFTGAIVGGTSSAVVIPMVKQMKLSDNSSSVLILESALIHTLWNC